MFCARVGAGCPDRAKSDPQPAGRGVLPKPGSSLGGFFHLYDQDRSMTPLTESDIQSRVARLSDLRAAIATAIVGQHDVVEQLLTGLLAGGHCLLEGVPGLGKTLLVRTLGQALELQFRRVQFTPDLMPSDLLGTELLEEDHGTGRRAFRFQKGPVFTHLLLADELNRTPPKTQAALLEAMQEHTVSFAGVTHALPEPFFVLATQNPIEQAGTYPLPEAQLDRFLLHIALDYPGEEDERAIIAQTTGAAPAQVPRVMGGEDVLALQAPVRQVHVGEDLLAGISRLVVATPPDRRWSWPRRRARCCTGGWRPRARTCRRSPRRYCGTVCCCRSPPRPRASVRTRWSRRCWTNCRSRAAERRGHDGPGSRRPGAARAAARAAHRLAPRQPAARRRPAPRSRPRRRAGILAVPRLRAGRRAAPDRLEAVRAQRPLLRARGRARQSARGLDRARCQRLDGAGRRGAPGLEPAGRGTGAGRLHRRGGAAPGRPCRTARRGWRCAASGARGRRQPPARAAAARAGPDRGRGRHARPGAAGARLGAR